MKKSFIGDLLFLTALATFVFIFMLVNCGANLITIVVAGCAFASPLLCAKGHEKYGDTAMIIGLLLSYAGGWWCVGIYAVVRFVAAYAIKYGKMLKVEE